MNTLKLKVLLILSNSRLWRSVRQSFLIWFTTGIIGSLGVGIVNATIPEAEVFALSLFFSSPAVILGIPVIYLLPSFPHRYLRGAFAIFSIIIVCAFIIGIITRLSGLEYVAVAEILFPYVLSAIGCFFIVAGKEVVKNYYRF